jgi:hypothetical protein
MTFRFRLAAVLDWYERQYRIEADRLRQHGERAAAAHDALVRHRESRLVNETEALRLESLRGNDLRAREFYREWSLREEARLDRVCQDADMEFETQRSVALSARRKLLLVEKLRDRKRDEFNYIAGRELEQVAADSWLAGFARNLTRPESE